MHHELETLVLSQRKPTLKPAVGDVRNWPIAAPREGAAGNRKLP